MRRSLPLAALLTACVPVAPPTPVVAPPPPEPPPSVRLPNDVHPTRYALALTIDPERDGYRGEADIEVHLDGPRDTIWLHGSGLDVSEVSVFPAAGVTFAARWEPGPRGLAAIRLGRTLGPVDATVHIAWRAPYQSGLVGIYRVSAGGRAYVYSQLEAIEARRAFPCFDEPRWKTPFEVTLTVPEGDEAVGNAAEAERAPLTLDGKRFVRVRLAPTEPLPTYLVAIAVGPFEVVEAPDLPRSRVRDRPVPVRGVAVHGRGADLALLLHLTTALVPRLEDWFQIAYPYGKLDVIAVPEFGHHGMENAGAVTFREASVLLERPSAWDELRAASLVAHELAHQWFGDLVTMTWWDDAWLAESFATWVAMRVLDGWRPEMHASLRLREQLQRAIRQDSDAAARSVRQPVASDDDIDNAFDALTYLKGAAILGMAERWLGGERFRLGVHRYLEQHRHAGGTMDDLLRALSEASGQDAASVLRGFLEQPGLPHLGVAPACAPRTAGGAVGGAVVTLTQSRERPLGGDAPTGTRWRLPVCLRWGVGQRSYDACTVLDGPRGELALPACPDWVMPDAGGASYAVWSLPPAWQAKLEQVGYRHLEPAEKLSLAQSVRAGLLDGSVAPVDALRALEPIAREPLHQVVDAPLDLWSLLRLQGDPATRAALERYTARALAPARMVLGWEEARPGPSVPARLAVSLVTDEEGAERALRRASVLRYLALEARDPAVRAEAKRRGDAWLAGGEQALPGPLVAVAVGVAVQEGGVPTVERAIARLVATSDSAVRERLAEALGVADGDAGERARALLLDPRLRPAEVDLLYMAAWQLAETHDALWAWLPTHLDALVERLPANRRPTVPLAARGFCDDAHRAEAEALFAPRLAKLPGGTRNLAYAVEEIGQCVARTRAIGAPLRAALAARAQALRK